MCRGVRNAFDEMFDMDHDDMLDPAEMELQRDFLNADRASGTFNADDYDPDDDMDADDEFDPDTDMDADDYDPDDDFDPDDFDPDDGFDADFD